MERMGVTRRAEQAVSTRVKKALSVVENTFSLMAACSHTRDVAKLWIGAAERASMQLLNR